MDAGHILLGMFWLYDLNVISFDRSNIYTFIYNGKRYCLTHVKPRHILDNQKIGMVTIQTSKKPLHLLNKYQFFKKSREEGIMYVIVATRDLLRCL